MAPGLRQFPTPRSAPNTNIPSPSEAKMRTLILMRHAKTEANNVMGDKARELTTRGQQEAAVAGLAMKPLGVAHVLCSTSTRTRQTFDWLGLRTPDGDAVPVEFMDALYFGGTDDMLQRIGEIDDAVSTLLVIGHAPTIPGLSAELASASAGREADQILCHFPTSTFSTFSIPKTWAELADGDFSGVQIMDIDRPARGRTAARTSI